jgi:secreted trypsin-like serine protease
VHNVSRTKEVHDNMRQLLVLAVVTVSLTVTAAATGVIGGDHDNGAHPSTGALLVPTPGGLAPECSGVLVAPRVFLTAGHCTNSAISHGDAYVVFDDVLSSDTWAPVHGTAITDPAFGADKKDPHDLGVVLLDAPAPVAPASLPAAGAAETLAKRNVVPVSLGYGYSQRAGKRQFVYDGYRHQAAIPISGQTAAMLKLKDPVGASVCFGDSGGPQYLPGSTTIVSVTSGGNAQCKKGEATRLDTDSVRSFLATYVKLP